MRGSRLSQQAARAVEAGADVYLKKPFSSQVLVARIKALLRRYRLSTSRSGNE